MKVSKGVLVVALATGVAVALAAVAYAGSKGGGTISVCVDRADGTLYQAKKCGHDSK
jgi:hypothetical protein